MAAVYSTSFLQGHGTYPSVVYNVPPGFRMVVRDIELYWNGPSVDNTVHFIGDIAQTFFAVVFTVASGQRWASFTGRVVLNTGFEMTVDNDPVDVTVSGYLLTLP